MQFCYILLLLVGSNRKVSFHSWPRKQRNSLVITCEESQRCLRVGSSHVYVFSPVDSMLCGESNKGSSCPSILDSWILMLLVNTVRRALQLFYIWIKNYVFSLWIMRVVDHFVILMNWIIIFCNFFTEKKCGAKLYKWHS